MNEEENKKHRQSVVNVRHMKDAFNDIYHATVDEGDSKSNYILKIVENIMNNHWEV